MTLPVLIERIPDWLWIAWFCFFFGGGIGIFLVLEMIALRTPSRRDNDDTFSGYIWRKWTRASKARRRVVFFVLLGFLLLILWLLPHFLFEIV